MQLVRDSGGNLENITMDLDAELNKLPKVMVEGQLNPLPTRQFQALISLTKKNLSAQEVNQLLLMTYFFQLL